MECIFFVEFSAPFKCPSGYDAVSEDLNGTGKNGLGPTQIVLERSMTVHPFVTSVKTVLDLSSPRGIRKLARAELTLAETETGSKMKVASIPIPIGEVASSLHKVIILTCC